MLLHRHYKWELLGLLSLAFFFHQGDRAIYGVVLPEIQKDLNLSDTQLGLVGSLLFWTIALMTPIAGYSLTYLVGGLAVGTAWIIFFKKDRVVETQM